MKKLKTVLAIILAILAISALVYFLPTEGLGSKLPFLKRFYTNTTLEVIAINSKSRVKINGKEYGETPVTINELNPGDYTVELERISNTEDFYEPQTLTVKLTKNTTSRVEIEIGPAGILHGTVLYYTSQDRLDKNKGSLSVLCDVKDSKIYLDEKYLKKAPVIAETLDSKEYELEIVSENYETLKIPILVEEGYLLNVKSYLFPIPIIFEDSDNA